MLKYGLYVSLEAKAGKEDDVESFLIAGLAIVNKERDTVSWFAVRSSPSAFAIFDTFNTADARDAHLAGDLAKLLMGRADELFATPPDIQMVDILASKPSAT
ncbi:putative quinol monooxygenase [Phyllobacterium calauticae]|jgi:quinol monooxygenase YgiN|uniref:putative quinol monooxygenase n=1 Tax=Phyllobacterium calauticae TaxID=2817027 RepID=UPI001CBE9F5B|nr:antibiotic biosynthesis monooxygenase [Phyllobacterium calauticae]MBZ3695681.1 antibiotic biosynthesis monooxygenase [Phyllobacterium calauticae]